jgi:hypothetical protein
MTDKEFAAQKERIKKLIKGYTVDLGLGHWDFTYKFEREKLEVDSYEKNESTIMSIAASWEYKTAIVRFHMLETKDLDDKRLKRVFFHEMVHALVAPMSTKTRKREEEMVATDISNALYWLEKSAYQRGLKDGRRNVKAVRA